MTGIMLSAIAAGSLVGFMLRLVGGGGSILATPLIDRTWPRGWSEGD
ncbi:hypothetical protein [Mesorhizobium sp. KR1-2]